MKQLWTIVAVAALAACGGGGSTAAKDGDLHGHCYPNATCNASLVCSGGVCVEGTDIDAAVVHDSPTIVDSSVIPDAPHPDSSVIPDAFVPDSGVLPDAFVPDSGVLPDAATVCNVLTQTGCLSNEKCTWIHDQDTPTTVGHTGCAPNGTVAVGGACTFGTAGATGYDNCTAGNVCTGAVCEQICDNNGGAPTCNATHACQAYQGLFDSGGIAVAGVCDPSCNPLDDNDFDGSGSAHTRAGSACGSDQTLGCYGLPSSTTTTHFTCAHPAMGTETLRHRSVIPNSLYFVNSCAPGYTIAFSTDNVGSNNVDCYAFCKPGDSYMGLATQNPNGVAPHRCNTTDAVGAFGAIPTAVTNGTNGEHCVYSWLFEVDNNTGTLLPSPTSNTVGICWDHSKYQYDANGDGTPDTIIPPCTALPLTVPSGSTALSAVDVSCVSTTTAGLTFTGKPPVLRRPIMNLPVVPAFQHR